MEWQSIVSVIAMPVVGSICWIIFHLNAKLEAMKEDQADYKIHVADTYVKRADAKEAFEKFDRVLERVEGKIDRLQTALNNSAVRRTLSD